MLSLSAETVSVTHPLPRRALYITNILQLCFQDSRGVCGYQHILGIIRTEDDPNSPDLQKRDPVRRTRPCEPICKSQV